jgi:DNA polymerase-3 subunit delta'
MSKGAQQNTTENFTALAMPYPWQADQWQQISEQFMTGRCPHGLLFSGPVYVGKKQFSSALAQLALCNAPIGGYACGGCKACKLFAAGNHPDFLQIEPEELGKAIKVDQIRLVNNFVAVTSQQGGWKVVVISPAEAMNVNAANALLKSLEEPSANTLLLLVCHTPSQLTATIRSRTRILPFPVPPLSQALAWLNKVTTVGDNDPQYLLDQSCGKPLLALKLIESDLLEQKIAFTHLLDEIAGNELSPLVAAERCFKLNSIERVDWLLDRITRKLKEFAGTEASRRWFIYMDRVILIKRELQSSSNPNLQLLWESLLMDWQIVAVSGN